MRANYFKILILSSLYLRFYTFKYPVFPRKESLTKVHESFIDKLISKFAPKPYVPEKSEDDELLDYLEDKPWRATKVKNLKIHYRPWKDSYKERYRTEDDDTIYLYSIAEYKSFLEKTRVDEVWIFPWFWTKIKVERLSWIQKQFLNDAEAISVQEFMEMDNFFSEFDMPLRWGILRMREADVVNMIALNLAFYTDFNGVKPTDLGLRPDGTVRVCPVQFHNCLSSSNSPLDTEHYAEPFRWSRSKSPDQAYEEIKNVYFKYPKRGLKWTNGWIDRGGWKPQQFSGPYFHAQAESMTWHYTDDIELVLDNDKREVQYRSQMRIGQVDWDVERLRYNQFCRMLQAKGGWEVRPMNKLQWMGTTPYRWTELILDKAYTGTVNVAENIAQTVTSGVTEMSGSSGTSGDESGLVSLQHSATELVDNIIHTVQPFIEDLKPYTSQFQSLREQLLTEPSIQKLVTELQSIETLSYSSIQEFIDPIVDKIIDIIQPILSVSDNTNSNNENNSQINKIINQLFEFFHQFLPSEDELKSMQQKLQNIKNGDDNINNNENSNNMSPRISLLDKLLPKSNLFKDDPMSAEHTEDEKDGMSNEEQTEFEINMLKKQQQTQTQTQNLPSPSSMSPNFATENLGVSEFCDSTVSFCPPVGSETASKDDQQRKSSSGSSKSGVIFIEKDEFLKIKNSKSGEKEKDIQNKDISTSSTTSSIISSTTTINTNFISEKTKAVPTTTTPSSIITTTTATTATTTTTTPSSFFSSSSSSAATDEIIESTVFIKDTVTVKEDTAPAKEEKENTATVKDKDSSISVSSISNSNSISKKISQLELLKQKKLSFVQSQPTVKDHPIFTSSHSSSTTNTKVKQRMNKLKGTIIEDIIEKSDYSLYDDDGRGKTAFDPSSRKSLSSSSSLLTAANTVAAK